MTQKTIEAVAEMRKAIRCLALEVPEAVHKDVSAIFEKLVATITPPGPPHPPKPPGPPPVA